MTRRGDGSDWRAGGKWGVKFVSQTFRFRSIHLVIHISPWTERPSPQLGRRWEWNMDDELCVRLVHFKIFGEDPRGKVQRPAVNEIWDADINWKNSKWLGVATQREDVNWEEGWGQNLRDTNSHLMLRGTVAKEREVEGKPGTSLCDGQACLSNLRNVKKIKIKKECQKSKCYSIQNNVLGCNFVKTSFLIIKL